MGARPRPAKAGDRAARLRGVYTWFDALLVTLLAIVTALGVRRGLTGLIWGLCALLLCLLVNAMTSSAALAALLSLLLSGAAAYAAARIFPQPYAQPWFQVAGGVGGFLLGTLLISALALSFPLERRGGQVSYPARTLPEPLYGAVGNSVIQKRLLGVWNGNRVLRLLVVPDRAHPQP